MPELIRESNGVIMTLGGLPKPPDVKEDKYRRAKVTGPLVGVNVNQSIYLVTPSYDPRGPIFGQGNSGSCASCAPAKATFALENLTQYKAGRTNPDTKMFNPAVMYYLAREEFGWQDEDTGSYLATNCDLILEDGPLLTDQQPYTDDYKKKFTREAYDDGVQWNYILSHQPFYDQFVENVILALEQGFPSVLVSYWPDAWFRPVNGKIPEGILFNPLQGAHAYWVWGYTPGWLLCDNSWLPPWTPDAAKFGHHMRAGSFALPVSYAQPGGPIFEGRVLSPELVKAGPSPRPDPNPEPLPEPIPPDIRGRIIQEAEKEQRAIAQLDVGRNKHKWMDKASERMLGAIKSVN